ncbi:MAG: isoaspartyl peptidase/L-asparaginase [Sphingomonas sp.]
MHPSRQEVAREGCRAAVEAAATILRDGGCALDAAEKAVCVLEDDANFNAGSGAVPTTDGDVELDAAIMDGSTLEIGAVAAIKSIRHRFRWPVCCCPSCPFFWPAKVPTASQHSAG